MNQDALIEPESSRTTAMTIERRPPASLRVRTSWTTPAITTSPSPQSCEIATSSAARSYRRGRWNSRSATDSIPRARRRLARVGPTPGSVSTPASRAAGFAKPRGRGHWSPCGTRTTPAKPACCRVIVATSPEYRTGTGGPAGADSVAFAADESPAPHTRVPAGRLRRRRGACRIPRTRAGEADRPRGALLRRGARRAQCAGVQPVAGARRRQLGAADDVRRSAPGGPRRRCRRRALAYVVHDLRRSSHQAPARGAPCRDHAQPRADAAVEGRAAGRGRLCAVVVLRAHGDRERRRHRRRVERDARRT